MIVGHTQTILVAPHPYTERTISLGSLSPNGDLRVGRDTTLSTMAPALGRRQLFEAG